jgi:hypothetical protein
MTIGKNSQPNAVSMGCPDPLEGLTDKFLDKAPGSNGLARDHSYHSAHASITISLYHLVNLKPRHLAISGAFPGNAG